MFSKTPAVPSVCGPFCKVISHLKRFLTYLFLLFATVTASGQNNEDATGISGVTIDAQTGDTLPFVQIYFMKPSSEGLVSSGIGTTSEMDGRLSLISRNP